MTFYWVESLQPATKVPFKRDYDGWISRMKANDLAAIRKELNRLFDETDIQTAGWIPGNDWSGTVWSPIYHDAARGNFDLSAKIFGLIVFEVAMHRTDAWVTGRFEKDGVAIRSRTYFRPGDESPLRR